MDCIKCKKAGEHTCVVCHEPVCWKCNWAKSCLAVCIICHDNEQKCVNCGLSIEYDCDCALKRKTGKNKKNIKENTIKITNKLI
jgi:hypothetical protein